MKAPHLITGFQAEALVIERLEQSIQSFTLVARNVRYKHGEIDIIYEYLNRQGALELVFVEVKASHESIDQALWNFSPAKQSKFKRAVQTFLATYRGRATQIRLCLALVSGPKIQIMDWVT